MQKGPKEQKSEKRFAFVDGDLAIERGQDAMSFLMSLASSAAEGLVIMRSMVSMLERIFKIQLMNEEMIGLMTDKLWPRIDTVDFKTWLKDKTSNADWNDLVKKGGIMVGAMRCIAPSPIDAHVMATAMVRFLDRYGQKPDGDNADVVQKLSEKMWPAINIDKIEIRPLSQKTGVSGPNESRIYSNGKRYDIQDGKNDDNIMYG